MRCIRSQLRRLGVGIALGVALPGCFVPKSTGLLMQDDINGLKTDVRGLRRDLQMLRASESEHTEQNLKKLEEMSAALQEFNQSARTTDADFGMQMERMIHDVQELRGTVEVNEHRLGETEQTLAQRIDALVKQNAALPGNETAPQVDEDLPSERKAALAYAARLQRDDKVTEARAAYRALLRRYPKELGTTDEIYFRLGESYAQGKKFDQALREYIHIVEKFGRGAWVDDAYYKIALCSLELGRLEDGRTFLREIVTNHPKSRWLKAARARLNALGSKKAGGG